MKPFIRCSVIAVALPLVLSAAAWSQELQTWRSKFGHTTRGVFSSFDEKSGTITILIPRKISIGVLDDASQRLARQLAGPGNSTATSSTSEADAGPEFIREKYRRLLAMKDKAEFQEFGFAQGGPYAGWMRDVSEAHKTKRFDDGDSVFAITHLQNLGLEYVSSGGEETTYSRFAKQKIESILAGRSWMETPNRTKLTTPAAMEYKFVDDDVYGEVFGFTALENLKQYWSGDVDPNPTASEKRRLGIVPIPAKTKVRVVSKHPLSKHINAYLVIPTTSSAQDKRLFVIQMDLFDERDPD